jgi:hypothetical protein
VPVKTWQLLVRAVGHPQSGGARKGPRFRFLCEKHLKLPKKKQDEVLAKAAEKNQNR